MTLVEKVEVDDWDDVFPLPDVQIESQTDEMVDLPPTEIQPTEDQQSEFEIPSEVNEGSSEMPPTGEVPSPETHVESQLPDLSNIKMPVQTKRRGRPKGTVNRVVGLPKKRKCENEKAERAKRVRKPMNQVVNRLQLFRIPGSDDWACSQ